MQRKEINFNVYFEKVCIMNSFVFFSHISLVINLYFIGLLRISKKLLSYIFSEIINLIHLRELGKKILLPRKQDY